MHSLTPFKQDLHLFYCLSFLIILLLQVLHAFATEGAHCSKVRDILSASDVSLDTFVSSILFIHLVSSLDWLVPVVYLFQNLPIVQSGELIAYNFSLLR